MSFDRQWLGSDFFAEESLEAAFNEAGLLQSLGLRTTQRTILVTVDPCQATTVEHKSEDLTMEEWLDGWRHHLLEQARPKPFQPSCSFCGKTSQEVRKLIAGPSVMICNECVELCREIIVQGDECSDRP